MKDKLWINGLPTCPFCGCYHGITKLKYQYPVIERFKCNNCGEKFTIKIGTLMEGSKLPLKKWLLAIFLMNEQKNSISSCQLAKELGCTQKTAWFIKTRYMNNNNPITSDEAFQESISINCNLTFN
ncbi:MAG: ISSpo8, transposase [Haloplasmataceae bacterium]|nr:ISSpo8, transposase [Haloplasmataceae bacterium]